MLHYLGSINVLLLPLFECPSGNDAFMTWSPLFNFFFAKNREINALLKTQNSSYRIRPRRMTVQCLECLVHSAAGALVFLPQRTQYNLTNSEIHLRTAQKIYFIKKTWTKKYVSFGFLFKRTIGSPSDWLI